MLIVVVILVIGIVVLFWLFDVVLFNVGNFVFKWDMINCGELGIVVVKVVLISGVFN